MMPIQRCQSGGKPGWKWGKSGKCYTGPGGRAKAARQAAAIRASGWAGNVRVRLATNAVRNPLRMDPSRTTALQQRFMGAIRGRLNAVKSAIFQLVVVEDAFGLAEPKPYRPDAGIGSVVILPPESLAGNVVLNQRYRFLSSQQKVVEFQRWLQEQMRGKILDGGVDAAGDAYWRKYIDEAFKKGQGRAFDDYMKKTRKWGAGEGSFYAGSKAQFVGSSFNRPVSIDKVKLLSARVYTELEGVTGRMGQQIGRHLTDGIAQGMSPREVGRRMAKEIDGIGTGTGDSARVRADRIARTETIRAHAEGQLVALEELGVTELGVMVEWSSAPDERTCPLCIDLEGVVVDIRKAGGMIPRHPNCRCVWIPANVGEDKKQQKRGVKAQEAIDKSIGDERSAKAIKAGVTVEDQKAISKWMGADTKIGRPQASILDKKGPLGLGTGVPKYVVKMLTPQELRLFRAAMQERRVLRRKVQAKLVGLDGGIRIQQLDEEIGYLKNLARTRAKGGGVIAQPQPVKVAPKPKVPEPRSVVKPVEKPTGILDPDATTPIDVILRDDDELNSVLHKVVTTGRQELDESIRLRAELKTIGKEYDNLLMEKGTVREAFDREKNVARAMGRLPKDDERFFYQTAKGKEYEGRLSALKASYDAVRKELSVSEERMRHIAAKQIGIGKKVQLRIKPKPITDTLGLRPGDARKVSTRITKKFKDKAKEAGDFLSNATRQRQVYSPFSSSPIPSRSQLVPGAKQLKSGSRAFHSNLSIYCTESDRVTVYVHELGHFLEESHYLGKRAREFRNYRIAKVGTTNERLTALFPNYGFDVSEIGNKDDWDKLFPSGSPNPYYIGKSYSWGSTEVISMGVQLLYENPIHFAVTDPEYFKFIIGVLRGTFR